MTLWRPHWAYDAFPLKNLEDPEGAFGDAESIHSYGEHRVRGGLTRQAAGWLEDFTMDSETLMSLVEAMFIDDEGDDYAPVVEKWISENQDYVDGLTASRTPHTSCPALLGACLHRHPTSGQTVWLELITIIITGNVRP